METRFTDHLARVDRLLALVRRGRAEPLDGGVTYHDLVMVTCQGMWGLRDLVLNDRAFAPADTGVLRGDIHGEWCLRSCADVARGESRLVLSRPRPRDGARLEHWFVAYRAPSPETGFAAPAYFIDAAEDDDPYHGADVRAMLLDCRESWGRIVERHWLTGDWW